MLSRTHKQAARALGKASQNVGASQAARRVVAAQRTRVAAVPYQEAQTVSPKSGLAPRGGIRRALLSVFASFFLSSRTCVAVEPSQEGSQKSMSSHPQNVLGGPLESCCTSPMTGFYRDGFCRTDMMDHGKHVVCARVTQQFLEYSRSKGNDLMTPAPWASFPGLKDGDKWCLCALRWREALDANVAPPLYLRATHKKALEYLTMEQLKAHALDLEEPVSA